MEVFSRQLLGARRQGAAARQPKFGMRSVFFDYLEVPFMRSVFHDCFWIHFCANPLGKYTTNLSRNGRIRQEYRARQVVNINWPGGQGVYPGKKNGL